MRGYLTSVMVLTRKMIKAIMTTTVVIIILNTDHKVLARLRFQGSQRFSGRQAISSPQAFWVATPASPESYRAPGRPKPQTSPSCLLFIVIAIVLLLPLNIIIVIVIVLSRVLYYL